MPCRPLLGRTLAIAEIAADLALMSHCASMEMLAQRPSSASIAILLRAARGCHGGMATFAEARRLRRGLTDCRACA